MSTCHNCQQAAQRAWHEFTNGCTGCCARAAARGQDFARVRKLGVQDRSYRALLDHFNLTHDQVREADRVDMLGKEAACDDSC